MSTEIKPELWADDTKYGTRDFRIHVGTLQLWIAEVGRFGKRLDLQQGSGRNIGLKLIPPKRWPTLGFFRKGWLAPIAEERPVDDVLQVVRDLAVRLKFNPMPGPDLRVGVGNNKLYATGDTCSWELRCNEFGVSCWHSHTGNRAAWPERTVSLSTYGRVVTPVPWVMDTIRKHVDQIVDPYAWKDKETIRIGGRER